MGASFPTMKISEFFEAIFKYLVTVSLLIILMTFASSMDLPPIGSPMEKWKIRHIILYMLDLKHEGTIATWWSSLLFLMAGLSFVPMGWPRPGQYQEKIPIWIFRLNAFAFTFFSLDEMVSIHERIGVMIEKMTKTLPVIRPEQPGLSWVFVYGPIVLVGIITIGYAYARYFNAAYGSMLRGFVWILLLALVCVPVIILMELAGGMIQASIEEALEIAVICTLIYVNSRLSKALHA